VVEFSPVLHGASGVAAARLPAYLQQPFDFPAHTADTFHDQLSAALAQSS